MLVDRAEIYVRAGKGGDGCVSFRREKFIPKGGPDGGDGGDGGNVFVMATAGVDTLLDFAGRHHWIAKNGQPGMGKKMFGKKGADLTLQLPPGTLIYDRDLNILIKDLSTAGERICIAESGKGGKGNARFARPDHQTPREAEEGTPGQERWLRLELKLIADAGIVGLPNAGKSTLLSRLSAARPKIADYPFTTLQPQLGIVQLSDHRRFVLADIPGLIEGAHEGAGLGDAFLRHIERTRVILHVVDVGSEWTVTKPRSHDGERHEGTEARRHEGRESDEATLPGQAPRRRRAGETVPPAEAYQTIRAELAKYSPQLAEKEELVVANKIDLTGGREAAEALAEAIGKEVLPVSAVTGIGLGTLVEKLWTMIVAAKSASQGPLTLPSPPEGERGFKTPGGAVGFEERPFVERGLENTPWGEGPVWRGE